jgi:GTP-binding protein
MLKIESVEFIKSVTSVSGCPKDGFAEIAFVGRSNVGKSSLINKLVNRKSLARTSGTPGKTREINYFLVNRKFYFVDLPGYGYAKTSKEMKDNWKGLLEEYLTTRETLKLVVVIIDSRHPDMESDLQMTQFAEFYGRHFAIVRTKIDKLSQSKIANAHKASEAFYRDYDFMQDFSAENGRGKNELLVQLENYL